MTLIQINVEDTYGNTVATYHSEQAYEQAKAKWSEEQAWDLFTYYIVDNQGNQEALTPSQYLETL